MHLELHTEASEGAREFIEAVCGWRADPVRTVAGTYLAMDGAGLGAGIIQCAAPRPLWLPYVAVPDVRRAADEAQMLGARVLLDPREGPAGWRAVVSTPAAGELAFWQQKR